MRITQLSRIRSRNSVEYLNQVSNKTASPGSSAKCLSLAAAQIGKSKITKETDSPFNRLEVEWFSRNSYNFSLEHCSDLHPLHLSRLASASVQV
jgi:hypothetical protein